MSEKIVRPNRTSESSLAKKTARTFEPVGSRAFHAIAKIISGGVPAVGGLGEWLSSNTMDRGLTDQEIAASVQIAQAIEQEAFACLARFLADAEVRESIRKGMLKSHLKLARRFNTARRIDPMMEVVRANVDSSAAEIVAALLGEGVLKEVGTTQDALQYLYVENDRPESDWRPVTPHGLISKISRLKKKIRED